MRLPLRHGYCELEQGVVVIDGATVRLSATERRLLAYLAARPHELVSYEALLVDVWGAHPHGSVRPIESALARLRKRLGESGREPVHLHTEYGEGLRFVPATESESESEPEAEPKPVRVADVAVKTPMSPSRAVDWLRPHALPVPLRQVVEQVGGHPEVLQQVVAAGAALTARALKRIDPLQVVWGGQTFAERLAARHRALTPPRRAVLHATAAFVPPVEPSFVAEALDRSVLDVMGDIAQLVEGGWCYRTREGVGVDGAAVRWLATQPGQAAGWAQHRDFLESKLGLQQYLEWYADIQAARARFDGWQREARLGGEAWATQVLGADPAHPLDAALIQATHLCVTGQLAKALDVFQDWPAPDDPHRRLRWGIVGSEIAACTGDLGWHTELLDTGDTGVEFAPAPLRFQHACNCLELAHRACGPLDAAAAHLLEAAQALDSSSEEAFAEGLLLHYRFERAPSEALAARLRALCLRKERPTLQRFLVLAERELSLPNTLPPDAVVKALSSHPERRATFCLAFALAALPDRGEAAHWLLRSPPVQRWGNRLRCALLQRILEGGSEGLRDLGGDALVARVEALLDGDESALPGEGWFVLRHALRVA